MSYFLLEETYHQFNADEDDASFESRPISIRDEATNQGQYKCSPHEVGKSGGRLCQAQVHISIEISHKAHSICNKRHVLESLRRCTHARKFSMNSNYVLKEKLKSKKGVNMIISVVKVTEYEKCSSISSQPCCCCLLRLAFKPLADVGLFINNLILGF